MCLALRKASGRETAMGKCLEIVDFQKCFCPKSRVPSVLKEVVTTKHQNNGWLHILEHSKGRKELLERRFL